MIIELVRDCADALAAMPAGHPKRRLVRTVGDALRLSSHVLIRDPLQLPSQLWGRLPRDECKASEAMLAEAQHHVIRPWLRPVTASLTHPGGPLLRTLEGHMGGGSMRFRSTRMAGGQSPHGTT